MGGPPSERQTMSPPSIWAPWRRRQPLPSGAGSSAEQLPFVASDDGRPREEGCFVVVIGGKRPPDGGGHRKAYVVALASTAMRAAWMVAAVARTTVRAPELMLILVLMCMLMTGSSVVMVRWQCKCVRLRSR